MANYHILITCLNATLNCQVPHYPPINVSVVDKAHCVALIQNLAKQYGIDYRKYQVLCQEVKE